MHSFMLLFVDSFVDLNVRPSRRRYGAERGNAPTPGVSDEVGGTPRGRNRAEKDVTFGRDPPTKKTNLVRVRTGICISLVI